MRLLNVSKEKALSLMTAIIYILPKQTFAHHCLLDILIKKKKKSIHTHKSMYAFNVNTKKEAVPAWSYFAARLPQKYC